MKRIKKVIVVFTTFYLTTLMISFLGFQFDYTNAMETTSSHMDMEAKFIVYPDGTVGVSGKYNHTSAYQYVGPTVQVSAQIAKDSGMHSASIDATLTVPSEEASEFPFNATTASMSNEYSNGILSSDVNASVVFPDRWYMDSTMYDFSGFPLNSTDFTISGEYSDQAFSGMMTIHMASGLALGDVAVHFEGNTTEIVISDSVTVLYDLPLPIAGFTPLNETYLDELLLELNSTVPGEEPGSLYNMTGGMLTCTTLDTTRTSIENGAEISFLVVIRGDFVDVLAEIFAGSSSTTASFSPYPVTPSMQSLFYQKPNATTIYPLLNATICSMKSGGFNLSYSKAARKLDLQASFTQDSAEYLNAATQIIPAMYPTEIQPYIESMLNATYCSAHSYTETVSYNNGQMNYEGDYVIKDDLNAEVNHLKNLYFDMMNAAYPAPPQMNVLRDIYPSIGNLRLNFKMENASTLFHFDGAKVTPPIDSINATCFRLEKFFSIASSEYESPRKNEKMKLAVQGASNGTHTVTLLIDTADPDRVPDPDELTKKNTMIWNNQSISRLKRLIFEVREGYVETIHDPASVTPDNPLAINAEATANCVLTLTDVSKTATLTIKNVTVPTGVSPPPGTYKALSNYIQITAYPEDVAVNGTIRIYYTPEQLSESGLDESSLKIFYWDEATNNWASIDTQINTAEHYVSATVSHLSIWTIMGQPLPALWEQPWFFPLAAVIIVIGVFAVLAFRKKKQLP